MSVDETTLFRTAALERLSTPDRLDQTLRLASSKAWMALAAVLIIIGATAFWAWKGSVATTVSGMAVIVRTGGMVTLSAQGNGGQIVALNVAVGERVKRGQVVARIAQPILLERIHSTEEALSEARHEGLRAVNVRRQSSTLQVAAIERQRSNINREIDGLAEFEKVAAEQVRLQEQLMSEGLTIRQQVIDARQKLASLRTDIARRRAELSQLEAQQYIAELEPEHAKADSEAKVMDLERKLAELKKEMSVSSIVPALFEGEVIEVKVQPGGFVSGGAPLVTIQPIGTEVEALMYVSAERAKEIAPGMDARISPTTMSREEFGHIKAKVVSVSGFPASAAALMRSLQNETLARAVARDGTVTEVRAQLERDPSTPTGFKWSSSKGPWASISAGTLCTADVTTREQAPLSLVFQIFRKKIGG
jgi:HlyD family secretion protein